MEVVLCSMRCLGAFSASTHSMMVAFIPQMWQPKVTADIAKYPLGNKISPVWDIALEDKI